VVLEPNRFCVVYRTLEASTFDLLSFLACGILSGLLIGAIGIGGVILVPLLTFALGVDIYQSIAASIFAFVVSGFVGTFIYAKRKVISWREIKFIWIGAAPSTLCGALLLSSVSKEILTLLIAFLTLGSAARELLNQQKKSHHCAVVIAKSKLIFIGAVTGFFSSLSGTGGPLILIPLMLWSSVPITMAIGLAQSIQLPISIFATVGNSWSGILNLSIAIPLATGIAFGTYFGGIWIRGVPTSQIKKGVAIVLAVIGIAMTTSVLI